MHVILIETLSAEVDMFVFLWTAELTNLAGSFGLRGRVWERAEDTALFSFHFEGDVQVALGLKGLDTFLLNAFLHLI